MRQVLRVLAVGLLAGVAPAVASAAPIYADSASVSSVTFFGSGILTGAPDDGGAWLSDTGDPPTTLGSITAGFAGGIVDGAGDDIVIHDCCGGAAPTGGETADVLVSTNGIAFTFLGAYGPANAFDLNGVFGGVVHYVKIVNTSRTNSPDIDAFQANYAAPVPEPATLLLFGSGLAVAVRRRGVKRA